MLKGIGAVCVLLGGLLARQMGVAALRREEETLEELIAALERLLTGIRMTRLPLPRLLARLAQDCRHTGAMFAAAAETMGLGEDMEPVWRAEVQRLALPSEAKRLTAGLALGLLGDEEAVSRVLEGGCRELDRMLKRLRTGRRERETRTTALCLSGAALLVILLI